ncbi:MAG: glycosyltransferase family 2 protein [Patescibacteria group bacterium]
MSEIDLSIIILNYNAKEYLKSCVQSIKDSNFEKITKEIILVDNNSPDSPKEIFEHLKKTSKNLNYVYNEENLGFSAGNNRGVEKSSGKYVLFLNPDTKVSEVAIKTCFKFMEENKDVGVCGPALVYPNGELTTASHRGFPTPWNAITHFTGLRRLSPKSKLLAGYTMGWLLDNKNPHEVDALSGAAFFVRREAGEEVGWWDEDYFLYGEDIDFCFKLNEKGWKVFFLPSAKILHYHGVSSGIKKQSQNLTSADIQTKKRAIKASTDAMRIFYKKHYPNVYPSWLTNFVLMGISILERFRLVRVST